MKLTCVLLAAVILAVADGTCLDSNTPGCNNSASLVCNPEFGNDFSGNWASPPLKMSTSFNCCDFCQTQTNCTAYSFYEPTNLCFTYARVLYTTSCEQCASQNFTQIPEPKPCEPVKGKAVTGPWSTPPETRTSPEECCRVCTNEADCVAYEFYAPRSLCFKYREVFYDTDCPECYSQQFSS